MSLYKNMLPKTPIEGHRGYYPVCNKDEWEQLPDLYKVMEWEPVKDPFDKDRLRAVKAVVFDVTYLEPYGVNAKVAVHPQEVQKILFCSFGGHECHLYSICEVELEGGSRLPAKWYQDSTTGAFGIYAGRTCVARQGGYEGFIPERIRVLEDGAFEYDRQYNVGKTHHYTILNPFDNAALNFCKENQFEDVSINSLEVVRVAVSIDELTKLEEMDAGAGSCLDDVIRSCKELSKNDDPRTDEKGCIDKVR